MTRKEKILDISMLLGTAIAIITAMFAGFARECDELRESARQEAAELHKNTLDYMDSLLADTDRKLSELINNIRLERNEIQNRR